MNVPFNLTTESDKTNVAAVTVIAPGAAGAVQSTTQRTDAANVIGMAFHELPGCCNVLPLYIPIPVAYFGTVTVDKCELHR